MNSSTFERAVFIDCQAALEAGLAQCKSDQRAQLGILIDQEDLHPKICDAGRREVGAAWVVME